MPLTVVILAAGRGTRMKSTLPKMLHRAAGRPLLEHVVRAAQALRPERIVIVVGEDEARIRAHFAGQRLDFVRQPEPLGTGHALQQALEVIEADGGDTLVLNGDAPLLTGETLRGLLAGHRRGQGGMTLLTYEVDDPSGLGRIVRGRDDAVLRIVEEKDAGPDERAIREINPGFYLFDDRVFRLAACLTNDNAAGEYLLTDLVALYQREGLSVRAQLGQDEAGRLVGVNTRAQLARAERLLRDRIRRRWLTQGVTMHSPEQTFIDDTVELARDVLLEPGVVLRGATRVGEGATIGAYAYLENTEVPAHAQVPPHAVERRPATAQRAPSEGAPSGDETEG